MNSTVVVNYHGENKYFIQCIVKIYNTLSFKVIKNIIAQLETLPHGSILRQNKITKEHRHVNLY